MRFINSSREMRFINSSREMSTPLHHREALPTSLSSQVAGLRIGCLLPWLYDISARVAASLMAMLMDYSLCVQRTSLSVEGSSILWRDSLGLTLRSFALSSPPLDATFCSFHDELILCVLQSPQLLRMHNIDRGGAQDIHLKFEIQRIHYCHRYQAILCVPPSAGLYSITWPSLQPYPVAIHPHDISSAFNIGASMLDLICSIHDSTLCIWRLGPYQSGFDEDVRMSVSVSHRSSMSPRTESKTTCVAYRSL